MWKTDSFGFGWYSIEVILKIEFACSELKFLSELVQILHSQDRLSTKCQPWQCHKLRGQHHIFIFTYSLCTLYILFTYSLHTLYILFTYSLRTLYYQIGSTHAPKLQHPTVFSFHSAQHCKSHFKILLQFQWELGLFCGYSANISGCHITHGLGKQETSRYVESSIYRIYPIYPIYQYIGHTRY